MRIGSFLLHGVGVEASRNVVAQLEKALGLEPGRVAVHKDEPLSSLPDHAPSVILVALQDAQELFRLGGRRRSGFTSLWC